MKLINHQKAKDYKILAAFLHDRQGLARALRGELQTHPIVAA